MDRHHDKNPMFNDSEMADAIVVDIVQTLSKEFGGGIIGSYSDYDISLWYKGFEFDENGDIYFYKHPPSVPGFNKGRERSKFITNIADPECKAKLIAHLRSLTP